MRENIPAVTNHQFQQTFVLMKTSTRFIGQEQYIRLGHTFSRRLQDIFKTFWSCPQDIFKTSCKDVFKTFSRCIIELNCSCQHVFEMYLIHFWDLLQKRLYTEGFALVTLLRTLRSVCRICTSEKKVVKFSFSLCCTF